MKMPAGISAPGLANSIGANCWFGGKGDSSGASSATMIQKPTSPAPIIPTALSRSRPIARNIPSSRFGRRIVVSSVSSALSVMPAPLTRTGYAD